MPSGKIRPLEAFFWDFKACENLKPGPGEGGYVDNLFKQSELGEINVGPVEDCRSGGCHEGELDLSAFRSGKLGDPVPESETCGAISDNAISTTAATGPGPSSIQCS